MALFKSAEDKAAEQASKEQALLDKYGLGTLSDPEDLASVKKIAQELLGTGMMEFGTKLASLGKADVVLPITYQRAIMEQNFIIIRQLDKIATLLNK